MQQNYDGSGCENFSCLPAFRYFKSTKVEPFVPDAEDGFPAEGGGYTNPGYHGTQAASKKGCGVDSSEGGIQLMSGDTGQGPRTTGQATGPESVSRGEVPREGYSAKDERNLKPPLKGHRVRYV